MKSSGRGFTLVELLVVVAILAVLAGIILPVFASVRASARRTSCLSNLKQLGQAMTMYTTDWDHYPRGLDPADKVTPEIWTGSPSAAGVDFTQIPLLPEILSPYVKEPSIWKCPADSGFDWNDITQTALDARPTCYEKYGMSYMYRTELTLLNLAEERVARPSETNVLCDGDGAWHGAALSNFWNGRRYNVLFADGHAKNLERDEFFLTWTIPLR